MKYRKCHVTNSSSSSFVCDICGRVESGWDMGLSEAGMYECVNGHTFCWDESLKVSKEDLIKIILEEGWNKKTYYNHLEVVVLNTNIIDNKTLNFFKDEFTAIDYLVLGTEDSLEELFKNYHKRNDYKSFINKERNESASIINVTFKEFLSSSLDDIKDASIPLISYKNNLRSEGIYIPSSKIILGRSLARANYLINNKIDAFNTKVQLNNDYYEVNVYDLKPRISYKNNTINIKIEGKIDSPDSDDLRELKKIVIKDLKDNIFELINNERKNNYNISNVINYIYLKTRNANYSTYNKADISININLKEEDKNNYG